MFSHEAVKQDGQALSAGGFVPPGKSPMPLQSQKRGGWVPHSFTAHFDAFPRSFRRVSSRVRMNKLKQRCSLLRLQTWVRFFFLPCTAPSLATGAPGPTTAGKASLSLHPHTTKPVLGRRWTSEKSTAHSAYRKPFASCQHHLITLS